MEDNLTTWKIKGGHLFLMSLLFLVISLRTDAQTQGPSTVSSAQHKETSVVSNNSDSGTKRRIAGRVEIDNQTFNTVSVSASIIGKSDFIRTAANESGEFVLDNLSDGKYKVYASSSGYIMDEQSEDLMPEFYRPGDTVTIKMVKGAVITGKVTNLMGEPVVEVPVQAIKIRDSSGRIAKRKIDVEVETDDRGIYRIYGLTPGTYIVVAGGPKARFYAGSNSYFKDRPTYYPSSTRDTAGRIVVHSGQEYGGIDISYRGEEGRVVSGTVIGPDGLSPKGGSVKLLSTTTKAVEAISYMSSPETGAFSLYGVADGKYELVVTGGTNREDSTLLSGRLNVVVRGSDVSGLRVVLASMGTLNGKVFLEAAKPIEPNSSCKSNSINLSEDVLINLLKDNRDNPNKVNIAEEDLSAVFGFGKVKDDGTFQVKNLEQGSYRILTSLTNDNWYIREMRLIKLAPKLAQSAARAKTVASQPLDLSSNKLTINQGESISGVTATITEGAAKIQGRVVSSAEGSGIPRLLRIHLVPAEKENADNVLRYAQAKVKYDGSFTISNIAPGKYWVVTQPIPVEEPVNWLTAWSVQERNKLKQEAELGNVSIELKPCQRINDYKYTYTIKGTK